MIRVATTYRVFSETVDEPVHVAAGLQWLTTDRYDLDIEHPPLARIGFALEPFFSGFRVSSEGNGTAKGNEILYRDNRYSHNLANVRAPNLIFLGLAIAVVTWWSLLLFDTSSALIAAALLGSLPPILGHGGVATTDMAAAALTVAASFALWLWVAAPSWRNTLFLAAASGFGLTAKFSFLVFFSCALVPIALTGRARRSEPVRVYAQRAAAILVIAAAIVWGAYKFSFGHLNDIRREVFQPGSGESVAAKYASVPGYAWVRTDLLYRFYSYSHLAESAGVWNVDFVDWAKAAGYPSPLAGRRGNTMAGAPPIPPPGFVERMVEPIRASWQWIAMNVALPAPAFIVGAEYVARHSRTGHPAFLLGRYSDVGWWYYFPVLLFFKTPIPFLIFSIIGFALMFRAGSRIAALAILPIASLLAAMTSSINIGVRHVLPLYPFLSIIAAFAVVQLWRVDRYRAVVRSAVVLLLVWQFFVTAIAHPDYLAWFNEFAGRHPEQIAVDSNLDWGQDLLRLVRVVRQERIPRLYVSYFGAADWKRHLPEGMELPRTSAVRGWIAISEMKLKFDGATNRGDGYQWLRKYKRVREVGKSIRLYFIP